MKKNFMLLISLSVLFFVSCGGSDSSDSSSCTVKSELVGTWDNQTNDVNSENPIVFNSDGTAFGLAEGEYEENEEEPITLWCVVGDSLHIEFPDVDWQHQLEFTFAIDNDSFFMDPNVRTNGFDANGTWTRYIKYLDDYKEEGDESTIKIDVENIEYNYHYYNTEDDYIDENRNMKGIISWQETTFSIEVTEFMASYGEDEDKNENDPSVGDTLYGCHWRGKDILEISFGESEMYGCDLYEYVKQ